RAHRVVRASDPPGQIYLQIYLHRKGTGLARRAAGRMVETSTRREARFHDGAGTLDDRAGEPSGRRRLAVDRIGSDRADELFSVLVGAHPRELGLGVLEAPSDAEARRLVAVARQVQKLGERVHVAPPELDVALLLHPQALLVPIACKHGFGC